MRKDFFFILKTPINIKEIKKKINCSGVIDQPIAIIMTIYVNKRC